MLPFNKHLTDDLIKKLLGKINTINIEYVKITRIFIENSQKNIFSEKLKNAIHILRLSPNRISIKSLKLIIEKCPNLEELDLANCNISIYERTSEYWRTRINKVSGNNSWYESKKELKQILFKSSSCSKLSLKQKNESELLPMLFDTIKNQDPNKNGLLGFLNSLNWSKIKLEKLVINRDSLNPNSEYSYIDFYFFPMLFYSRIDNHPRLPLEVGRPFLKVLKNTTELFKSDFKIDLEIAPDYTSLFGCFICKEYSDEINMLFNKKSCHCKCACKNYDWFEKQPFCNSCYCEHYLSDKCFSNTFFEYECDCTPLKLYCCKCIIPVSCVYCQKKFCMICIKNSVICLKTYKRHHIDCIRGKKT